MWNRIRERRDICTSSDYLLDDHRSRFHGQRPQVVDDAVPLLAVGHGRQGHVRLPLLQHPHHPVPLALDQGAEQSVVATSVNSGLIIPN